MRKCKAQPKPNAYEKVTQRMIDALEAGTVPWRKPWKSSMPMSIHGRNYRGFNAVLLALLGGFESPVWLTFNQAKERGGSVRKGEKGMPVLLWKPTKERKDSAGNVEREAKLYCTTYTVFNIEQCDGVELPNKLQPSKVDPIEAAEALVAEYRSQVSMGVGGDRACYSPSRDHVQMPPRDSFQSAGHYYSTLFHELVHSTGHLNRLNRDLKGMGTDEYSFEELVAELGACMLMALAGIEADETFENSAAYVTGWLRRLNDDRTLIVKAASAAQKAVDLIVGAAEAQEAEAA